MDIQARFYTKEDYSMLTKWWEKWNQAPPPEDYLPFTGVMIYVENTNMACGFLYETDSNMCLFDFMVSNPFADKKKRCAAIEELKMQIKKLSKARGYKMIYTSKNCGKFIKRLENHGYIGQSKGNQHMFCEVA